MQHGGASRFEIESRAGSGAMGVVYRARDRVTGGPIALKILGVAGELALRRFEHEAALLRDLSHPGIVRYVDHGTTRGGEPYLAMEWLEGENLGQRLSRAPMGVDESLCLAAAVSSALGAAHARGIVHRDLKPQNLFLDSPDVSSVKLLDFGIAVAMRAGSRMTQPGASLGTPGYAAPEQIRGDERPSPSADIFSLGCILFECLAGRPAFTAEHPMALLAKILFDDVPPLSSAWPDAPPELCALLSRMLANDPADRFADAAALGRAIAALGPGARAAATTQAEVRPALTTEETRFVSVVAAAFIPAVSAGAQADPARILPMIAAEYNGRYSALAGDAAIVLLTGHAAAADGAARAARCALTIQSLFPEIRLAVAVESMAGPAEPLGAVFERVAGLLDAEPVSMPMSRRGASRPPAIVLDDTCARWLDAGFVVTSRGSLHSLWSERDIDEHRTLLGKRTSCVGRDAELRALEALLVGCFDELTPRVALVTGPPGIGKSRVRVELVRRIHVREIPVMVWTGRADPTSRGSPFALIGDLLRRLAGISPDDPLPARASKLLARVARDIPPDDVDRVAGFLGEVTGASAQGGLELRTARRDPTLMGDQIQRAFSELVRRSALSAPVLLILEDLHFGDYATVKLVDGMLRDVGESPVFVLATARPEVSELFPDLWRAHNVSQIPLSGLGRRAVAELVHQVLGDAQPELGEEISRLAKGNAFFAEELIRSASRRVSGENKTIVAMLEARIAELSPDARLVLRAASVFGERFEASGVVALVGGRLGAPAVDAHIEEMCDKEVLSPGAPTPRGARQFAFRHALLRDAAHAMLTEGDRTVGHRLAGEYLVRMGDPDAARLASHFEQGGARDEAAKWYAIAADRSVEGNDFAAAVLAAERGLSCGAAGDVRGRLLAAQAEAVQWSGDVMRAHALAREAASLVPVGSATWRRAAAPYLAGVLAQGGEPPLELVEELERLPLTDGDRVLVVASTAAYLILAEWPEVVAPLLDRLREVDPAALDEHPQAAGWLWCARSLRSVIDGLPERALSEAERCEASFLSAGDRRGAGIAQVNVGCFLVQLGLYERAARISLQARQTFERMGLHSLLPHVIANEGLSYLHLGDLDRARPALLDAVEKFGETGDRRMHGTALCYLSWLALREGDGAEAAGFAERATQVLEGTRPRCLSFATLARALLHGEADVARAERALALAEDAVKTMNALGGADEGEAYIRLAEVEALIATRGLDVARAALQNAHARLITRAQRIEDVAIRRAFLQDVPEHATTLSLAAAQLESLAPIGDVAAEGAPPRR